MLVITFALCALTWLQDAAQPQPVQFRNFSWGMTFEAVREKVLELDGEVLTDKAPKGKGLTRRHGKLQIALNAGEGLMFRVTFSFDKHGLKKVFMTDFSEKRSDREIGARYDQLKAQMQAKGWILKDLPKIENIYRNLEFSDEGGRLFMREERMPLELKSTITIEYSRLKVPSKIKGDLL